MPQQRRPAVPSTPPREPKELAAALRELAAQTEEPTIRIGRRRPVRPPVPDGASTAAIEVAGADPPVPGAHGAADPAPDPDTAEMRAIIPETPPPVGQEPDPDQPAALGEPDLIWRRGAKVLPAHRPRSAGHDDRSSTIRGRRVRLWPAVAGAVLVAVAVGLVALLSAGSTPRAIPAARTSAPASTTIPAPASPVRHRSLAARRRAAARAARHRAAALRRAAARRKAAARRRRTAAARRKAGARRRAARRKRPAATTRS